MDYEKEDLIKLLACLQSELEAREDVIRNLKSPKHSNFDSHAKYGLTFSGRSIDTFDSSDPFSALERDSITSAVTSPADYEDALKSTYDNQLVQLENLIASQRHAREVIRERLMIVERKYEKTCNAVESPNTQPIGTENQCDRLRYEIEQEKSHCKQLEIVIKRILSSWKEKSTILFKQKQLGALLLKERRRLLTQLVCDKHRIAELENLVGANAELHPEFSTASAIPKFTVTTNPTVDLHSITREELVRKCEHLMQTLDEEIASRATLQANFERLQMEYHKLAPATSLKKVADLFLNESVDPNQRPKPDPPKRRSSEITNPHSNTVVCHDQVELSDKLNVSAPSVINEPIVLDIADAAPKINQSESRSSTPSPPPPPVQLHFPYPGMQTHDCQQPHPARNRSTATNKLSFINSCSTNDNRPLSGSQSSNSPITSVHKTRSLTTSPHPTAGILFPQPQRLPYRHPMSLMRQHLSTSPHSSSPIQDLRPRTHLGTNQSSPCHSVSQMTPPTYRSAQFKCSSDSAPIAELFVHTKPALPNQIPSNNNVHNFPGYNKSPHRSQYTLQSHLSSPSPCDVGGQKNVRPTRIAVPSSTVLTEGQRTAGTGHLCIGGK